MPEMAPLYHDMRVKEYLHFRAELKGLRGRDLRHRTGEVMELCAVTDVRRRVIGNLSKGFKQRVALADALIHRPKLLILDEPTNGLDPTQIRGVRELLRSLREQHTILLSTHILHEVEQTCDRVIMIHASDVAGACGIAIGNGCGEGVGGTARSSQGDDFENGQGLAGLCVAGGIADGHSGERSGFGHGEGVEDSGVASPVADPGRCVCGIGGGGLRGKAIWIMRR
jgi:energy-coupling factor transporter ATP-binding protein EcfA2